MAASMEIAVPAAELVESPGRGSNGDAFVLHPYLYPHALLKVPHGKNGSLKKSLGKLVTKGGREKEGENYLAQLEDARHALRTVLESPSVGDQAVSDAAASYIGLLLGLVSASGASSSSGKQADAAAAAASPDEALEAAESGAASGSSTASPLSAPPSKLRMAGQYEWSEAVLSPPAGAPPRKAASSDALFELASALVAVATRLMHAAALACLDSPSGVATPASTRGYKLLREAAGMLEFAAREVLPALPAGLSADCDLQVVRALATAALADAQQLTVLRAVAKGNQPALIASLAADTAALYSQACSQLVSSPVPGAASCKLWQYGQYKQAHFMAYAHCFNGISQWKAAENCGGGLKCLEAAAAQVAAAKRASGGYDAAPPASLNLHHRRVDEDLERILSDTQRRMQRENDSVYMQRLPAEVPPLPEGKRLVGSLPYALPQAAAAVKEGVVEQCFGAGPAPAAAAMAAPGAVVMGADGKPAPAAAAGAAGVAGAAATGQEGGEAQRGCSCCRWAIFLIAAPILALLWLLGALIWVLLLPLKCCIPCCGFPLQWAADLVLWLMKLPARMLMWVSGKPWEESKKEGEEGGAAAGGAAKKQGEEKK